MRVVLLSVLLLTGDGSVFYKARQASLEGRFVEVSEGVFDIQKKRWIPKDVNGDKVYWSEFAELPTSYLDEEACVKQLKKASDDEVELEEAVLLFKECMESKGWKLYTTELTIHPAY